MFPLKLLRSLVFGGDVTNNPLLLLHIHHDNPYEKDDDNPTIHSSKSRNRIPLMLFIPTQELVRDTYRLASIARAIGMDFHPNPSLSHIIFSWPSPPSSSSSCASSSSSTYPWSSQNDTVPLPFPSFATASHHNLRLFVNLSKGYFKLAFLKTDSLPHQKIESLSNKNWHCSSLSLCFSRTGESIHSMDGFSKALLGMGWTLVKTNNNWADRAKRGRTFYGHFLVKLVFFRQIIRSAPHRGSGYTSNTRERESPKRAIYLYRKLDGSKICSKIKQAAIDEDGDSVEPSRMRELRLPPLDFRNVPLRILHYILLMTDDVFFLA